MRVQASNVAPHEADRARHGRQLAGQQGEQRLLARTIGADQPHDVAARDRETLVGPAFSPPKWRGALRISRNAVICPPDAVEWVYGGAGDALAQVHRGQHEDGAQHDQVRSWHQPARFVLQHRLRRHHQQRPRQRAMDGADAADQRDQRDLAPDVEQREQRRRLSHPRIHKGQHRLLARGIEVEARQRLGRPDAAQRLDAANMQADGQDIDKLGDRRAVPSARGRLTMAVPATAGAG